MHEKFSVFGFLVFAFMNLHFSLSNRAAQTMPATVNSSLEDLSWWPFSSRTSRKAPLTFIFGFKTVNFICNLHNRRALMCSLTFYVPTPKVFQFIFFSPFFQPFASKPPRKINKLTFSLQIEWPRSARSTAFLNFKRTIGVCLRIDWLQHVVACIAI